MSDVKRFEGSLANHILIDSTLLPDALHRRIARDYDLHNGSLQTICLTDFEYEPEDVEADFEAWVKANDLPIHANYAIYVWW